MAVFQRLFAIHHVLVETTNLHQEGTRKLVTPWSSTTWSIVTLKHRYEFATLIFDHIPIFTTKSANFKHITNVVTIKIRFKRQVILTGQELRLPKPTKKNILSFNTVKKHNHEFETSTWSQRCKQGALVEYWNSWFYYLQFLIKPNSKRIVTKTHAHPLSIKCHWGPFLSCVLANYEFASIFLAEENRNLPPPLCRYSVPLSVFFVSLYSYTKLFRVPFYILPLPM